MDFIKGNFKVIATAFLTFVGTVAATTTTALDDKIVEILQKIVEALAG